MPPEILLKAYVQYKSEDAFRELVISCLDRVYSRALELSAGTTRFAEEITLQVFWELARKASSLPENIVLADWLGQQTSRIGAKILRHEGRHVHAVADAKGISSETNPEPIHAPRGLAMGVTQGVLLNLARKKSFLTIPRLPELKWMPNLKGLNPMHARIAVACALALLLLSHFPLPWHKRNPILPPRKDVVLTPSSFAQLASSDDGEFVRTKPEPFAQTPDPSDQP